MHVRASASTTSFVYGPTRVSPNLKQPVSFAFFRSKKISDFREGSGGNLHVRQTTRRSIRNVYGFVSHRLVALPSCGQPGKTNGRTIGPAPTRAGAAATTSRAGACIPSIGKRQSEMRSATAPRPRETREQPDAESSLNDSRLKKGNAIHAGILPSPPHLGTQAILTTPVITTAYLRGTQITSTT